MGHVINIEKSTIYFSKNTLEAEKENITSILGQRQGNYMGMYLGLSAMTERSKNSMLDFIKKRVRAKTKGWKGVFLSPAGKKIMLKAVLTAAPT